MKKIEILVTSLELKSGSHLGLEPLEPPALPSLWAAGLPGPP